MFEQRADPLIQLGMAFALRKDAPRLRQQLDGYLANLRCTPTWSRLVVEYFGNAALDVLKRAPEP